jgi:hypothetical protein
MVAVAAAVCVVCFVAAFSAFGAMRAASDTLATARGALAAFSDASLTDDDRERIARKTSLRLFSGSISAGLRAGAAVLVSALPILLADKAGLAPGSEVVSFLLRWDVLLVITVVTVAGYLLKRALWPSS